MNKRDIGFIIIEALIWICFLVMDYLDLPTTNLKYAGIVLCFLYSLTTKNVLLCVAQLFTLMADWFLLVIDKYYVHGVLFFLVVQIVYLFLLKKNDVKSYVGIRIGLPLVLIAVLYYLNNASTVNILSVTYFSQLLINCISSCSNKKLRLFSIGLSCFVFCDICVGLHNIDTHSFIIAWLQWFWYLPSQVLIVLTFLK